MMGQCNVIKGVMWKIILKLSLYPFLSGALRMFHSGLSIYPFIYNIRQANSADPPGRPVIMQTLKCGVSE